MIAGKTVVVFTAHPDDEVGVAGTLAKIRRAGNRLVLAVATDGSKGTHDPRVSPAAMARIRTREMEAAAQVLGAELVWLGYADGTLEHHREALRERVFQLVRGYRPDLLLTFDPWRRWEPHADHRTIGMAAFEAAYLADGCWYYPEHLDQGLDPHFTPETYLFYGEDPDVTVDIEATFATKLEVAACHASQIPDPGAQEIRWRERLRRAGRPETDLYREYFHTMRGTELGI